MNLIAIVEVRGGPMKLEDQVIMIIKAGRSGQAEAKIYSLFNGSEFVPHLVGTPVEMTGFEQMQLFNF